VQREARIVGAELNLEAKLRPAKAAEALNQAEKARHREAKERTTATGSSNKNLKVLKNSVSKRATEKQTRRPQSPGKACRQPKTRNSKTKHRKT
jgi:hypothetical protein